MRIYDVKINTLRGDPFSWADVRGRTLLIVNVASMCGYTPQYEGLQQLQARYADRGMTVIGVPCNQFAAEEPGSPEDIARFCSTTYGVTFPMLEKVEVNGPGRHQLFQILCAVIDAEGRNGDVSWNFEKFLVSPSGGPYARFRPQTEPTDPAIVDAIERRLPM